MIVRQRERQEGKLLCHPCRLAPIPEELQFGPGGCTTNCIRTLWRVSHRRYVEGGWVAGLVTPTRPNSNDEFLDFGSPSTLASQNEATSRHYARFVNLLCWTPEIGDHVSKRESLFGGDLTFSRSALGSWWCLPPRRWHKMD